MHPRESVEPLAALVRKITTLPLRQRDILLIFNYERLSLNEIATVPATAEQEVAGQFYVAHEKLGTISMRRELLEEADVA